MQVTTSAADSVVALIGIDKQMIAAAGKANIIQVDDVRIHCPSQLFAL